MIKTTKPVIIDPFTSEKKIVTAELTSIDFCPQLDEYKIQVNYSYLSNEGTKMELKNEVLLKSKKEIDFLFSKIGKNINTKESFTDAFKVITSKGTELVIKSSAYFGLKSINWTSTNN